MAEVMLDHPLVPIKMIWEGLEESYDSLPDLAVDLEFLQEASFQPNEARPKFLDSSGFEYRVLVMSLEVVLCVQVASGYDPGDLELVSADLSGERFIIEHLNGRVHRALAMNQADGDVYSACRERGALPCSSLSGVGELSESPITWEEFDRLWFEAMDPAPPLSARQITYEIAKAINTRLRKRATKPAEN